MFASRVARCLCVVCVRGEGEKKNDRGACLCAKKKPPKKSLGVFAKDKRILQLVKELFSLF